MSEQQKEGVYWALVLLTLAFEVIATVCVIVRCAQIEALIKGGGV